MRLKTRIEKIHLQGDRQPTYFVDYKVGDCWENHTSYTVYDHALASEYALKYNQPCRAS